MDVISNMKDIYDYGSEMIADYQRGKQMRLGSYKGAENTKKLGHYDRQGKRLAIYHG